MRFAGTRRFVTVGLAARHAPSCTVADLRRATGSPTLPPVVLDHWPRRRATRARALTDRRQLARLRVDRARRRPLRAEGALAARADRPAARGRTSASRSRSRSTPRDGATWPRSPSTAGSCVDPAQVAGTPDALPRFVRGSWAELGIAKSGYVASRCGWFSDRSACYLASGRPVVAQDTGLEAVLPDGRRAARLRPRRGGRRARGRACRAAAPRGGGARARRGAARLRSRAAGAPGRRARWSLTAELTTALAGSLAAPVRICARRPSPYALELPARGARGRDRRRGATAARVQGRLRRALRPADGPRAACATCDPAREPRPTSCSRARVSARRRYCGAPRRSGERWLFLEAVDGRGSTRSASLAVWQAAARWLARAARDADGPGAGRACRRYDAPDLDGCGRACDAGDRSRRSRRSRRRSRAAWARRRQLRGSRSSTASSTRPTS